MWRLLLLAAVAAGASPAPRAAGRGASSFLRHRSKAPTVCIDSPSQWEDSRGYGCTSYSLAHYCTSTGQKGVGWVPLWGDFGAWASSGQAADAACCACGGGKEQVLPACGALECPSGYSLRADAAETTCTSLQCNTPSDMTACCEQSKDVQMEADKIRVLAGELQQNVQADIASSGEAKADEVVQQAGALSTQLVGKLMASLPQERADAISEANSEFGTLTQGNEGLQPAAEHEILAVGYTAARRSTEAGEAHTDEAELQASAARVEAAYKKALNAWQSAQNVGDRATQVGMQEWSTYYKDLNATWPVVDSGIRAANSALDASVGPGQAVRWSREVTRLSTDLAQLTRSHGTSLDAQVRATVGRARQALQATQANSGKITTLEAQVAQAARNVG